MKTVRDGWPVKVIRLELNQAERETLVAAATIATRARVYVCKYSGDIDPFYHPVDDAAADVVHGIDVLLGKLILASVES